MVKKGGHHIEKIEVISESNRSEQSHSDDEGNESSSVDYSDQDYNGSEADMSMQNIPELDEDESSGNGNTLRNKRDSRIIFLIKKLTQGDLNLNESFNLDGNNQYNYTYIEENKQSARESNNTSTKKFYSPMDLVNSFHLNSQYKSSI